MKSFGVLLFFIGSVLLVRFYFTEIVLKCQEKRVEIRSRPPTFAEWSALDDKTSNHFRDMFYELEPTRLYDTTKSEKEGLIIPDYQKILPDDFVGQAKSQEELILKHPRNQEYLELSDREEREKLWKREFDQTGIKFSDLEWFWWKNKTRNIPS